MAFNFRFTTKSSKGYVTEISCMFPALTFIFHSISVLSAALTPADGPVQASQPVRVYSVL